MLSGNLFLIYIFKCKTVIFSEYVKTTCFIIENWCGFLFIVYFLFFRLTSKLVNLDYFKDYLIFIYIFLKTNLMTLYNYELCKGCIQEPSSQGFSRSVAIKHKCLLQENLALTTIYPRNKGTKLQKKVGEPRSRVSARFV